MYFFRAFCFPFAVIALPADSPLSFSVQLSVVYLYISRKSHASKLLADVLFHIQVGPCSITVVL